MSISFKCIVSILCVPISGPGLWGQREIHPRAEDEVAPAHYNTFEINPFSPEGHDEMALVSLEGMDLAVLEQGAQVLSHNGSESIPLAAIIENGGQLPDIPSATEVAKKGITPGKMNSKLLQELKSSHFTVFIWRTESKIQSNY